MIPGTDMNEIRPDAFMIGFGEEDVSGAANVDIWGGPTPIQPEPDPAGYEMFVVSSDAGDTAAGLGAQTVMIIYLDTAGVTQLTTATMNGLTEVSTGITDCMFVQEIHVMTAGGPKVGIGNIDCLAGSSGPVVQRIGASGNKSMSTMKQVPAGKELILTGWFGCGVAATTKIANIRIRSTSHFMNYPGLYHFISNCRVKDFASPFIPLNNTIPPLATVKVSAWTTGTISISAQWNGFLRDVKP